MKTKYLIAAAALLLAMTGTGCGSKETKVEPAAASTQNEQPTAAPVTAVPTITLIPTSEASAPAAPADGDLVEMQVATQENTIQNEAGQKTQTSGSVIVMNQTGGVISEFFVRLHPSDEDYEDEWGEDLIQTRYTLANGDKLVYYFEKSASPTSPMYDLRVAYTDPMRSECFFRNIPLDQISQITLRMEGEDEDSIPYATYMMTGTPREYSTLNDVKQRLGLLDEEYEDEDEDEQEEQNQSEAAPTQAPVQEEYIDTGEISGDSNPQTDTMNTAASYIGQSLSSLESAIGNPNGSDYEDEPEIGNTGYHYYGNFTVSTSVDDNGNEIVTGIW